MAVLITGGGGFIGSRIGHSLAKRGEKVVLFDISFDNAAQGLCSDGVTFVNGDIRNCPEVMNLVRDYSISSIFHFASMLTVPSEASPWASINVNAMGTYNVLEAARLFHAKKVIFTGSIASYGVTQETIVTNATPQKPNNIYGVTKVFSELLGLYYQRKFGIDFRGIRFPALIGPGVKTAGLGQYNSLVIEAAIMGKPYEIWVPQDTVMPMMYIKDAINALLQLYDAPEETLVTRIYNSGQIIPPPTAEDLVDMVKRYCPGTQVTFRPDPALMPVLKTMPRIFKSDEAEAEWGWMLSYSVEEMVKDFIDEFKKMN